MFIWSFRALITKSEVPSSDIEVNKFIADCNKSVLFGGRRLSDTSTETIVKQFN